jgi:hypothetical protein
MREADQSPPSSAEVKHVWSYTSTPPNTSSWRGAQLRKKLNHSLKRDFSVDTYNEVFNKLLKRDVLPSQYKTRFDWSTARNVPFEKLIVTQLIKKFPTFYEIRKFTTAHHWSIS